MELIKIDEDTFVRHVDELYDLLIEALLSTEEKQYSGPEMYLAIKKLLIAYASALGPEVVKKIEQGTMFIHTNDYKS